MLTAMLNDASTTSTSLLLTVALLRLKTRVSSKTPTQELQLLALGDFQHGRASRVRAHRTAWARMS
jgi:hypothetical protein